MGFIGMATRDEIDRALNGVQEELYAIVRKHSIDVPDCAIEEIAVYFVTKEVPTLYDWDTNRRLEVNIMLKDYEASLGVVLRGKKVVDVAGFVVAEFGADTLVFKITRIIFDDGSSEDVEGEHDMPYIPNDEEHQQMFEPYFDHDC